MRVKNIFNGLVEYLKAMDKSPGKHSVFVFVKPGTVADPGDFSKSPLAALLRLRDSLRPAEDHCREHHSVSVAQSVVNGEYVLVEYHLFVKHTNEHILAEPKSTRSLQVARGQSRGQNAAGNVPASIYGHPPIDYEGLPKDEDL